MEVHDWSKYCMPLYFAGNVFDPDLGSCLAGDFDQGSQDPMLQAFFNCTVFHNILEGSTKHGHHEGISLLGNSDSSLAIKTILYNGPPSKMRVEHWLTTMLKQLQQKQAIKEMKTMKAL